MKRFAVLAVLVCVAMGGLGVDAGAAVPAAPKLKAQYRKRDEKVRVTWRTTKIDPDAITVIEIERADDGGSFTSLDAVARRPTRYDDTPAAGGTYAYRARVISDNDASPWSNVVQVELPGATNENPGTGDPGTNDPKLKSGERECPAGVVDDVLAQVNDARRGAHVGVLRLDAKLQWAARKRAIDMAAAARLSHDGWLDVLNASGYHWAAAGENIAMGYRTPAGVMNAWLGSSGHHANIVGSYFRDTGIGCVVDRNGSTWWSEIFGG